ncbi:MAG: T9SS type A sorting domain-containing protein [Bacteroidetes bacterium]|nr:T9SS type A sorting domain-containing protein [Bacteroidota bacterium]
MESIFTIGFDKLRVAGSFTNGIGNKYVANWNGSIWSEVGGLNSLATPNAIFALHIDRKGNLYAAGGLINMNNHFYLGIYNGTVWSELGGISTLASIGGLLDVTSDKYGNIYTCGGIKNSLGNYYVAKYTDPNSIAEYQNDLSFSAYPNPATDNLNLVLTSKQPLTISIQNTLGETIIEKTNLKQNSLQLNVTALEPGIYFITIANNKKSITRKFIKAN